MHAPMTLRTAEGMLAFVDGCEDRETWIYVGLALKGEFGDAARESWIQWSSNAHNFNEKTCITTWRGLKPKSPERGMGGLVNLAKAGGYKFNGAEQPKVDMAEIARRRDEHHAKAQAEAAKKAEAAANAERVAFDTWHAALRTGESSYAKRKGIDQPESCRFIPASEGGGLIIPMLRYDLPREQSLKGVQTIRDTDGTKKYTPGMAKEGTACRLGLAAVGDPVLVCEGYATGMTLRMATDRKFAVYVAFDAYSLPHVVDVIYRVLPTNPIVICADDDYMTGVAAGKPSNVGRIQAQMAMDGVMDAGAKLVVRTHPLFRKETARGPKDTDFNDLHRLEGLQEVAAQLELCFDAITELKKYG